MSGQSIGQTIGTIVGYLWTGTPIGAAIGGAVGGAAGAYLDPPDPVYGPRLDDRKVQTSTYGVNIPRLFGSVRVAGNVIWAEDIEEVETETEVGGKGGPGQSVFTYSYFGTFAVLIAFGQIRGIRRMWCDSVLVYDGANEALPDPDFGIVFYPGGEEQLPDPTIEAALGVGNAPAYRGFSYFVVNRLPLERFGNRIPSITVEVLAEGEWQDDGATELPDASDSAYVFTAAIQRVDGHLVAVSKPTFTTMRLSVIDPVTGERTLEADHSYFLEGGDGGMFYVPPTDEVWLCDEDRTLQRFNATTLAHVGSVEIGWEGVAAAYDHVNRRILAHRAGIGSAYANAYTPITLEGHVLYPPPTAASGASSAGQLVVGGSTIVLATGTVFGFEALLSNVLEPPTANLVGTVNVPNGNIGCWDWMRQRYVVAARNTGNDSLWTVTDTNPPVFTEYTFSGAHFGSPRDMHYSSALDAIIVWHHSAGVQGFVFDADTLELIHQITPIQDLGATRAFMSQLDAGTALVVGSNQTYEVFLHGTTVGATVGTLCEAGGLVAADYDVSELTQRLRGYLVSSQAPARSAIEQLAQIYLFDGVEQDDLLYFRRRGGPAVATIRREELGAGVDKAGEVAVETVRAQELSLPKRVYINAPDPAMDHQPGSQYGEKLARQAGEDVTISTAAVLTANENKRTAMAIVFDRWAGRYSLPVATTRRYARLVPTDPIEVDGRRYRIVNRMDDGGVIQLECVSDDRDTINQIADGVASSFGGQSIAVNVPTNLLVLDIALLRDAEDDPGAYVAAYGISPHWRGGVIYTSADDGATWSRAATMPRPGSVVGAATNALGNWTGGNRFDEGNTLNVSLSNNGTPASTTRLGVLNGGNGLAIESTVNGETEWEILQYRDVELESNGSYTLTGLLRGRRGTEYAMAGHAAGDRVVLLSTGTIRNIEIDSSVIGIERPYRAVTIGDTIAQTPEQEVTITAERLYPWSPVLLGGGRNAAGDVVLNWVRRTRVDGEWRDLVDAALGESSEAYVVVIYTTSGRTAVARTISGLSAQTTTYTAAQQTSDFGSLQSTVYWAVRQVSATVGNGHIAHGTT